MYCGRIAGSSMRSVKDNISGVIWTRTQAWEFSRFVWTSQIFSVGQF